MQRSVTTAWNLSRGCNACSKLQLGRGASTSVKGWVYAVREHRDVNFIDVADGSQTKHVQVVASGDIIKQIGHLRFGDCVLCEGQYVTSTGPRQKIEFRAEKIRRFAENALEPSSAVTSLEQVRQTLSTRAKHPLFAALMRFRSRLAHEVRAYFHRHGYIEINCPILTTANCEATDCFAIRQSGDTDGVSSGSTNGCIAEASSKAGQHGSSAGSNKRSAYFGDRHVLLSGSAQFHLEAFSSGFSRTYSFAHTFRAEPSRTRHHLAEFWMIEAEVCFVDSLDTLLREVEMFIRSVIEAVLSNEEMMSDIKTIEERLRLDTSSQPDADRSKRSRNVKSSRHKSIEQRLRDTLAKRFERISYAEALRMLAASNASFDVKVDASNANFDIQKEHEKYLVRHFDEAPVFLTDFPASLKPFYMQANKDGNQDATASSQVETVACADLLVAGVGELVGGSLRENSLTALEQRATRVGYTQAQRELVDWYLQLRRAGLPPHAGFGVGFERLIQFLLQIPNIRDVVPFYRFYGSCEL